MEDRVCVIVESHSYFLVERVTMVILFLYKAVRTALQWLLLHPTRPLHSISVLLKSGLINFSGYTDQAILLTLKENGEAFMNTAEGYENR